MGSNNVLRIVHIVALVLVIIGALNWGMIGVADFNLVAAVFGDGAIARTIYALVGLSALVILYTEFAVVRTAERTPTHQRPAVSG